MTADQPSTPTGSPSQTPLHHRESVVVDATPEELYDLVSDVTRTGEWSPVCRECWWDDPAEAGRVGAWFSGRNETPERTWETRSQVVVASRGREFAWMVGKGYVRWAFEMEETNGETVLTETWDFLPAGLAYFEERFGDDAPAQVEDRARAALHGIPETLGAIKRIAEQSA